VLTDSKSDYYNVNPAGTTTRIFTTKLNRNIGAHLYFVYPNDPTDTDRNSSSRRWTITKVDGLDGTRRWIEAGTSMTGVNMVNDIYVRITNGEGEETLRAIMN